WREVLERNEKEFRFDPKALEEVLAERAAPEDLGEILAAADRIDEIPFESLAGLGPRVEAAGIPRAALEVAYQRRLRRVLRSEPLKGLAKLHDANVEIRMARAWRRDGYLYSRRQRQPWDRKLDTRRVAARAKPIRLDDPEVKGEVEACLLLLRLISDAEGGRPDPLVGTPYHPELLALNQGGERGALTVAFDPEERKRQSLRDRILEHNRRSPYLTEIEKRNAEVVNEYRAEYDLLPLRTDRDLVTSARMHARFQERVGAIAHVFPNVREPYGRTPAARMRRAGYPPRHVGGENVLFGTRDPVEAFEMWRGSPGHRRNMLSPAWTEIGVGESGGYWTQNFGTEPYTEDHDGERRPR
ncbi:MAG: CAP domain-containing protein, partial [Planctomycetota bacterium]